MKRILALFIIITTLLAGCGSPTAETSMNELIQAYTDRDYDKMYSYLDYHYEGNLDEDELEYLSDEYSILVKESGGMKNVDIKEIRQKEMNKELIQELNEDYGEGWYVTTVAFPKVQEGTFVFYLKKSDGDFYIIEEDYYDDIQDLKENFLN